MPHYSVKVHSMGKVNTYEGFILDIDGVLRRGGKPIPGAAETVRKLRQMNKKIVFLSNLSTKSREEYVETLRKIGIAFLYAPLYHSSFAVVAPIRRELGITTIFNILGPLCNPGFPTHQLLGVFSPDLVLKLANALGVLGVKRAFVVYGEDVKDEISLTGRTLVGFLDKKRVGKLYLSPSSFGLRRCTLKDLQVNNVEESAKVILDIFAGKGGAPQDIVLANASACFYILNRVKNLKEGVELAKSLIIQGKVREKFSAFKDFLAK